jgi:hypothetical protein
VRLVVSPHLNICGQVSWLLVIFVQQCSTRPIKVYFNELCIAGDQMPIDEV